MPDSEIKFHDFKVKITEPDTCVITCTVLIPIPYIEVTFTLSQRPKCPLCGYPAELLLTYHCSNEECQNYDSKLLEPCPEAGEEEFDEPEDTLELFPYGYTS